MSPAGQILFELLKPDLVYFTGKIWLEFRPGSLQDLANAITRLEGSLAGPPGTQPQKKGTP
jgi:hypothetical protein